ncbi:MAG: NADH-quinone oxidoreductase subunit F, partial [Bacteroidetes bacterium]|nr:NADH-quinone oxidoreductase subunit F [Bacteroidota bacterium]
MNAFSQNCFEQCWHCAEKPCLRFVDCVQHGQQCDCGDESVQRLEQYKRALLMIEHDIPVVLVGMGTCGLANGAQQIHDAIAAECEARGITATLIPVGCVGYCAREVIVDVKLPGRPRISYAQVTLRDVPALVERTIMGGEVIEEKLLGLYSHDDASDWSHMPLLADDSFFRKQKKVNLENCGVIDPESIDQYLARGGYAGLSQALQTQSSQEVIDDVLTAGLRGRGGGGFPTGKKWQFAHDQKADKKYLICNADEGDPGAFMDRAL